MSLSYRSGTVGTHVATADDWGVIRPCTVRADTVVGYATGAPYGAAGGDLIGTYPNPIIRDGVISASKIANLGITGVLIPPGIIPNANLQYPYITVVTSGDLLVNGTAGPTNIALGEDLNISNASPSAYYSPFILAAADPGIPEGYVLLGSNPVTVQDFGPSNIFKLDIPSMKQDIVSTGLVSGAHTTFALGSDIAALGATSFAVGSSINTAASTDTFVICNGATCQHSKQTLIGHRTTGGPTTLTGALPSYAPVPGAPGSIAIGEDAACDIDYTSTAAFAPGVAIGAASFGSPTGAVGIGWQAQSVEAASVSLGIGVVRMPLISLEGVNEAPFAYRVTAYPDFNRTDFAVRLIEPRGPYGCVATPVRQFVCAQQRFSKLSAKGCHLCLSFESQGVVCGRLVAVAQNGAGDYVVDRYDLIMNVPWLGPVEILRSDKLVRPAGPQSFTLYEDPYDDTGAAHSRFGEFARRIIRTGTNTYYSGVGFHDAAVDGRPPFPTLIVHFNDTTSVSLNTTAPPTFDPFPESLEPCDTTTLTADDWFVRVHFSFFDQTYC